MTRFGSVDGAGEVGRASPRAQWLLRHVARPLVRLGFRPRLDGLDHLPDDRPFLLVANHNAGMGIGEILSFAALYEEAFGRDRPLAGFAHPVAFRLWPLGPMLRALGAVPSTYDDAAAALESGVPLLVFPGGDHETLRPVWQAGRVDFNGRRGFLRIARQAGVPVVPMGIEGSHYTAPMLFRSKRLATLLVLPRLFGFKRWGVSLLGAVGAVAATQVPWAWPYRAGLAFAWLNSPFCFLPIVPWTIRLRIGEPIPPEELFADDDEDLQAAVARVQRAVQDLARPR